MGFAEYLIDNEIECDCGAWYGSVGVAQHSQDCAISQAWDDYCEEINGVGMVPDQV